MEENIEIKVEVDEHYFDLEESYEDTLPTTESIYCVFCGTSLKLEKIQPKFHEDLFRSWNESCWESLCRVFQVEPSRYLRLRKMFISSELCSPCHNLIRDVDFTLKCLCAAQERLINVRKSVETLLETNYNSNSNNKTKSRIKILYKTLICSSSNVNKLKQFSMITASPNTYRSCINKINSESVIRNPRRCRIVQNQPSGTSQFTDSDFADSGPEETENYDSDFIPPQAEIMEVIWKDNESLEEDRRNSDSEGSDSNKDTGPNCSSDEEWNNTKKKNLNIRKKGSHEYYPTTSSTRTARPKNSTPSGKKKLNSNKLCCPYEDCAFECRAQATLAFHVNKLHLGDQKPYHCSEAECRMKFVSRSGFQDHVLKKHGDIQGEKYEKTFPCIICDKKFFSKWAVKKHVSNVHTFWDKLRCSQCRKMFDPTEKDALQAHETLHSLKLNTDSPFGCVFCHKDFTNMIDLSTHVRLEHELALSENKCETCRKVFDTKKKLQNHMNETHKERDASLKCEKCPYIGLNKSSLVHHQRWHEKPSFTCHFCAEGYKSKSSLSYHLRVAHSQTDKEKHYECHICRKKFNSTSTLKAHEESHNKLKSYICETCGKAFKAKKGLHQHMKSHSDVKVRSGKKLRDRQEAQSQLVASVHPETSLTVQPQFEVTPTKLLQPTLYFCDL